MSNTDNTSAQIMQASQMWIQHFNTGNASACANSYTQQAIMEAKPFGTFTGREAILTFWTDLIASGASTLEYQDIDIQVLDEENAILSANWSMNIGRGFIAKEHWQKQGEHWYLLKDDFEVLEQYAV